MRYVITADVALRLARDRARPAEGVELVAPTLLRSQVLSLLYRAVQDGELTRPEAEGDLDHLRSLQPRLLGDRALQRAAWRVAEQLGWADTLSAEYVALTQLQADALVTLDQHLADSVEGLVAVAPIDDLL